MALRFYKTPRGLPVLLPGLTWRCPTPRNLIYLTFDDGPVPTYTPFVLNQLAQYQAQATFFCVGDNLRKYPDLAQQVASAGHSLANHTYHHLQGWQTPTSAYVQNVHLCRSELEKITLGKKNNLFRPPYGKISWAQFRALKSAYQIIMWDVLTYDFDNSLSEKECLQQSIKNTQPGSIVVFHDSQKASRNLQYVLPRFLAYFAQMGYRFAAL